ncbi:MAG: nitrate/nitrite transporter NrtS [Gammaproteobacteria bacterium]|nr:nitrate/nitrite transporter NrtS [Gammaproteobacteria bacterium]MDE0284045.1 nitrate/nitrite transporter NrtS [Gammaproteobacteria bacterium]MDE0511368.1 nitrate/nitrite transporter NrtS [Gammaproteobacteria bacterium]
MKRWLSIAARRDVVISSLKVCVVVGTVLVLINYFDRILAGTLSDIDYFKILLTYCVPYCVSTYASVGVVIRGKP